MKALLQKRWMWGLMTFFALSIAIVALLPYITFNRENFADIFDGRFENWSVILLYIHIISGGIALLVGPFQFWSWLRNKYRPVHRWLGRIYMFLGIFPAAISGIFVAQTTTTGLQGTLGFSLLGIFWFITGAMALRAILKRDIQTHQRWMIRNFALTFAAVTLRLWIPILMIGFISSGIDPEQAFTQAYQFVPWLSWIPNLIVAEMIINVLLPKQNQRQQKLVMEA